MTSRLARRDTIRLGISSAVSLACVLYLQAAAAAHHDTNYFAGPKWDDLSVEYYRNDLATWNNNWITSLDTAHATWSNINPSNGFTFVQLGEGQGTACGFIGQKSTVDKKRLGDGPAGVLARTEICDLGNPNEEKFYLFFDTDETWYHGQGDDFTNGTLSVWGVATHEFGHAAGFGDGASPNHFASPCDSSQLFTYQTMCTTPPFQDVDNAWRWYSLEDHDKHEFNAEY